MDSKLLNSNIHKVDRIADYLLKKASLERPEFYIKILQGNSSGYFNYATKVLAIPEWTLAFNAHNIPDSDYCLYYVAHELSHALEGMKEPYDHGEVFYSFLTQLCPAELLYWELNYLPDNGSFLNGLSTRGLLNSLRKSATR